MNGRAKVSAMDMLLLTAPADEPWELRSASRIQELAEAEFQIRAEFTEEKLGKLIQLRWVRTYTNEDGWLFVAPTREGAAAHFAQVHGVGHFLERDLPFSSGTIEALAHWFDGWFSPKSRMNEKLAEFGIPNLHLGTGTKWREAAWLFQRWNQQPRYAYLSALLVRLLHPEQWPNAEEERALARSNIEDIFRPAGLILHSEGYLTPPLQEEDGEPETTVWDDEDQFRRRVVELVLRRLPRVENVIYTHGNDEYGRDFLFCYLGPLGNRRWVAVQAKVGNVSGDARGVLGTILEQVQTAFAHPVVDVGRMGRVSTSEVVVIISGRFTNNARERILDRLQDPTQRANTSFLERSDIEGILRSAKARSCA